MASTPSSSSQQKLPSYVRQAQKKLISRQEANFYDPETGELVDYPFPDSEVVPFNPTQLQALQHIEGLGPVNPLLASTQAQQEAFVNQNAINNPLLSQYFNQAAVDVTGQMAGSALRSGGFGSSGHQEQLGRALSNLATNIYMPAWQAQEEMKQRAAQIAPGLAQGQYIPAQAMLSAGGMTQEQAQAEINAQIENEWRRAGWPYQATEMMIPALSLAQTGSSSIHTTNPVSWASKLQSILMPGIS